MSIKSLRIETIEAAMAEIRKIMDEGVDVPHLEQAKAVLMGLCAKTELFPREDFPVPTGDQTERTFLIHEDDGGKYALYVNSGLPGQAYCPHDHGGSWAIIAAVEGEETHHLYVEEPQGTVLDAALIRETGKLTVKPGAAVSMLPEGIHSISAGDQPLLHLHLYGDSLPTQKERKEFDLETNTVRRFIFEDLGIEDAR